MSGYDALWTPVLHRITRWRRDLDDTVTFGLAPVEGAEALAPPRPGQFHMLWVYGIGEVPISVSGIDRDGTPVVHTVRAVGRVTEALCRLQPGDTVGVRGPFGSAWPEARPGEDLLVVAGGLGLAPLRPVVHAAIEAPERFGSLTVVIGARSPSALLFEEEIRSWSHEGVDVRVTVDYADAGWRGSIGVVTRLLRDAVRDPARTVALVCGPEVMMRASARELTSIGLPGASILLSLERNMECAVGLCGHCQLGAKFVCVDGPVLSWERIEPLLGIREV